MLKEFAPYILPLLAVALIVRRSMRTRKVNANRMWIRPVFLLLLLAGALAYAPMPGPIAIAAFVVAAGAGAALGSYMATHQHLSIDEQTGHVSSRSSTIGTLLVLGLFAIRFGTKIVFPELAEPGHHAGAQMAVAANGLLIFTVAVLIAQTMSVWRRTQPLLAAHAAKKLAERQGGMVPQPAAQPVVQSTGQPTE
jgi:uncharacterized membrane protein